MLVQLQFDIDMSQIDPHAGIVDSSFTHLIEQISCLLVVSIFSNDDGETIGSISIGGVASQCLWVEIDGQFVCIRTRLLWLVALEFSCCGCVVVAESNVCVKVVFVAIPEHFFVWSLAQFLGIGCLCLSNHDPCFSIVGFCVKHFFIVLYSVCWSTQGLFYRAQSQMSCAQREKVSLDGSNECIPLAILPSVYPG